MLSNRCDVQRSEVINISRQSDEQSIWCALIWSDQHYSTICWAIDLRWTDLQWSSFFENLSRIRYEKDIKWLISLDNLLSIPWNRRTHLEQFNWFAQQNQNNSHRFGRAPQKQMLCVSTISHNPFPMCKQPRQTCLFLYTDRDNQRYFGESLQNWFRVCTSLG